MGLQEIPHFVESWINCNFPYYSDQFHCLCSSLITVWAIEAINHTNRFCLNAWSRSKDIKKKHIVLKLREIQKRMGKQNLKHLPACKGVQRQLMALAFLKSFNTFNLKLFMASHSAKSFDSLFFCDQKPLQKQQIAQTPNINCQA